MGKGLKFWKKDEEEKPTPAENQEPDTLKPERQGLSPKNYFDHQRDRLTNDERFKSYDDNKKKEILTNFFNDVGFEYLGKLGVNDEIKLQQSRDLWVTNTMDQFSAIPKKKDLVMPDFSKTLLDPNTAHAADATRVEPTRDEYFEEAINSFNKTNETIPQKEGIEPQQDININNTTFTNQRKDPRIEEELNAQIEEITPVREAKAESASEEDPGYFKSFFNKFASGSARLGSGIARTPSFIYDIASIPQNVFVDKVLGRRDLEVRSPEWLRDNPIAKYYDNQVEQWKKQTKQYDNTITGYLKAGDYSKALGLTGLEVSESLPLMIGLAMTGVAGAPASVTVPAIGLEVGAEKQKQIEDVDISEAAKTYNSIVTGLAEGAFESMGTIKIAALGKELFKKVGKEQAQEIVKKGYKKTMENAMKRFYPVTGAIGEGLEESATQFTENLTDRWTGVDPDRNPMDGVGDAFIVGVGSGGGLATGVKIAQKVTSLKSDKPAGKEQPDIKTDQNTEVKEDAEIKSYKIGNEVFETKEEFLKEAEKYKGKKDTPEFEVNNDNAALNELGDILDTKEKPTESIKADVKEEVVDPVKNKEKLSQNTVASAAGITLQTEDVVGTLSEYVAKQEKNEKLNPREQELLVDAKTQIEYLNEQKGIVTESKGKLKEQGFKSSLMEDAEVDLYTEESPETMAMDMITGIGTEASIYEDKSFPKLPSGEAFTAIQQNINDHIENGAELTPESQAAVSTMADAVKNRRVDVEDGRQMDIQELEGEVIATRMEKDDQILVEGIMELHADKAPNTQTDINKYAENLTNDELLEIYNYGKEKKQDGQKEEVSPTSTRSKKGVEKKKTNTQGNVIVAPTKKESKPDQETPLQKEPSKDDTANKHNSLVSKFKELNKIPKAHSKKRNALKAQIDPLIIELGYKYKTRGTELTIVDKDGKGIKTKAIKTPKEEIEKHNTLKEYPEDFQEFTNTIMKNDEFLIGIDVPQSKKQLDPMLKNITEGKKTVGANDLLDWLENSFNDGVIRFKKTKTQPAFSLTKEEFLESISNVNKELAKEEILEESSISDDEYAEIFNDYEDTQETKPREKTEIKEVPVVKRVGQKKEEPKEILIQRAKLDVLETELAKTKKHKARAVVAASERSGLFGDTKADPNAPAMFDETFEVNKETLDKVKKPFDDKIATLGRDIVATKKTIDTGKKELEGQKEIKETKADDYKKNDLGKGLKAGGGVEVDVEPLNDTKFQEVPKLRTILTDLAKGLKKNFKYTKLGKRVAGVYRSSVSLIGIQKANDIETVAHEVGHYFDDKYKLLSEVSPKLNGELSEYWDGGSKPDPSMSEEQKQMYKQQEGLAEWVRVFVLNPSKAMESEAIYDLYKNNVGKADQQAIKKFSDSLRSLLSSTKLSSLSSLVHTDNTEKSNWFKKSFPKLSEPFESKASFTRHFLNPFYDHEEGFRKAMRTKGVEKVLPSKDFNMLAGLTLGHDDAFYNIMEEGMVDAVMERLVDNKTKQPMTKDWLFDPARGKDFEQDVENNRNRMIAERTIEFIDNLTKKQILLDLNKDILPPDSVLEKHPELQNKVINTKQDAETGADIEITVQDKVNELKENEDIQSEDEKKYDFTSMDVTGAKNLAIERNKTDYEASKDILQEYDIYIKAYPKKESVYNELKRRYQALADANLKYALNKGRITQESYDNIKESNKNYIALARLQDSGIGDINIEGSYSGTPDGKAIGVPKEVIKKFKGSVKPIINPYVSLIESTYNIVKESNRNESMQAFAEMLTSDRGMREGDLMDLAEIGFRTESPNDPYTIPIYIKGERQNWRFSPEIYESLMGLGDVSHSMPLALTWFAKILRPSVTTFPVFQIRNRRRDFQSRLIISNNWPKFRDYRKKKEGMSNFELLGGGQFGYHLRSKDSYYEMIDKTMKTMAKNKSTLIVSPKNFVKLYKRLLSDSEKKTRVEEYYNIYDKYKKEGYSDYDAKIAATHEARGLLDFMVMGKSIRGINAVMPFTNAKIQGFRRMYKAAEKNPLKFTAKFLIYAMIPQIANTMVIAGADDDVIKEYTEFSDYRRDLFYNWPIHKLGVPGINWITIPKPFEVGILASFFGRFADAAILGNDLKQQLDGDYARFLVQGLTPFDPTGIATSQNPIQALNSNWDNFRQTHIISEYEKDMKVELRDVSKASRLGKGIQKLSLNTADARQVDFFIKNLFSYYGNLATRVSNIGDKSAKDKLSLEMTGLLKNSSNSPYTSKSVRWVLRTAKEYKLKQDPDYKIIERGIKEYRKETDTERKVRIKKTIDEHARLLRERWESVDLMEESKWRNYEK